MTIKHKILFGFIFVFTFVFILSSWAYYVHFDSVLIKNQKQQAKVVNKTYIDSLSLIINDNKAQLKILEKDGDIALAYDDTEWLSIVGVAKTKKKFKEIFKTHPYLKSMVFYKDNKILVNAVNKNDNISELLIKHSFDFSISNSKVVLITNPILFLQNKLNEDKIYNINHLYLKSEEKDWIITKDKYYSFEKKDLELNNIVSLDGKKFIASTCNKVPKLSFCQVALIPYDYYHDTLKNMIINIFLLYIALLIITSLVAKYLSNFIIKPINALKEASTQYENDKFIPITTHGNDEISEAIVAFNAMGKRISNFTHELQGEVEKRTKELKDANKKLEKLATTDSLTGLYNRAKIDEFLNQELSRFNRYGHNFSILILDLDDFKLLNDNFGHQVGDIVLKSFSNILQESVRKSDMIGRWGGEEFLIVLPETNLDNAIQTAKKIAMNLREYNFDFTDKSITASVGVGEFRADDTITSLFARVDKNLYKAKKLGKDLVIG
ncbi:diguanylate cyclase [Arcobacter roscoffensis]|uniref:diguanylate cyclase n=1 Tax=Arcobacter roscoffensis TaxID=2961520 RepID=A0ABY5E3G1_9BACT|nr:diguanylate cyclase [Arcobacter roscoffensis]UTJ05598.1 diguanylate cyclase [Arcobacter roscoffensis]